MARRHARESRGLVEATKPVVKVTKKAVKKLAKKVAAKQAAKNQSKTINKYGIDWPRNTSLFAIELYCYKTNRTPEQGGLGARSHFIKAFHMAWPNFFWHDWMFLEVNAWCDEREFTAIGHTRASKTYGLAYILFLDWLASPTDTLTTIASMSLERLRSTMGRDIMEAISNIAFIDLIIDTFEIINSTNEFRISLRPMPGMNAAEAKKLKSFGIIEIVFSFRERERLTGRFKDIFICRREMNKSPARFKKIRRGL